MLKAKSIAWTWVKNGIYNIYLKLMYDMIWIVEINGIKLQYIAIIMHMIHALCVLLWRGISQLTHTLQGYYTGSGTIMQQLTHWPLGDFDLI